jgi:hypothetical protein
MKGHDWYELLAAGCALGTAVLAACGQWFALLLVALIVCLVELGYLGTELLERAAADLAAIRVQTRQDMLEQWQHDWRAYCRSVDAALEDMARAVATFCTELRRAFGGTP